MIPHIFIDTNVVLDLLLHRSQFEHDAQVVFSLADLGKCVICISSLTISHVAYFLRKEVGNEKLPAILRDFSSLVTITPVDEVVVRNSIAINSGFSDVEDGLQYYSALQSNCQYIITRNVKDFKSSTIPVFTPRGFLDEVSL